MHPVSWEPQDKAVKGSLRQWSRGEAMVDAETILDCFPGY